MYPKVFFFNHKSRELLAVTGTIDEFCAKYAQVAQSE